MKYPCWLVYYLVKKKHKIKSYEEILSSYMDYHNSYGKDGFLSERTTKDGCERNAKAEYERQFDFGKDGDEILAMEKGSVRSVNDMIQITKEDNFHQWLNAKGQFTEENGYTKEEIELIKENNNEY